MALPAELVLVRHGQSEGNLVNHAARDGKDLTNPAYLDRPGSEWRLTNEGIKQAKAAGEWIKQHISTDFDRKFFSTFVRTQETAAHLNLSDTVGWRYHLFLYERRLGELSGLHPQEFEERHSRDRKRRDPFHHQAVGGESTLDVALRFSRVIQTLHHDVDEKKIPERGKAILVCHGDVIGAAKVLLERPTPQEFSEWENDPKERVHNCQVIHYTRRTEPENPDSPLDRRITHRRSICPWDLSASRSDWQPITFKSFTNEEMLKNIEHYPRVIETD